MKTVVIAGASGVVGSRVIVHLTARRDVARIIALGRRALSATHPKLVYRVVDLQSSAAIAVEIPEHADAAFCCLGTTLRQAGSKRAFRAVDYDAVVAFAEAARAQQVRRLVVVSSIGADPRSGNFYLKTKGEAEHALAGVELEQLTVVRPSLIDDEGARAERRLGERILLPLSRAVFAIAGRTSRYAPISADTIATALVQLAFDETPERVRTLESEQLHALAAAAKE